MICMQKLEKVTSKFKGERLLATLWAGGNQNEGIVKATFSVKA